jgi:hypothetical protein
MKTWCVVLAMIALTSTARATNCNASIPDSAGYRILRVVSDNRWGASLGAGSTVKPGDPYTQANVDRARAYVKAELDRQNDASLIYFSRVAVVYITPCTIVEPAALCQQELNAEKCVTLEVKTLALRLPAADTSALLVNRPRSPTGTDLNGVPPPIVATAPSFGLDNDAGLGTTVNFRSSTDLAILGRLFRGAPISTQPGDLKYKAVLNTEGFRSLNAPYYGAVALFSGAHVFNTTLKQISADASYSAVNRPMGEGDLRSNTLLAGAFATFNFGVPLFRSVIVGGGYNHAADSLMAAPENGGFSEDGFLARLSVDGVVQSLPVRVSAWYQHNSVTSMGTYSKVLLRSGFQKSIALRPQQTLDIELLAGYGRATGSLPAQDQFVGGNAGARFLDDSFASSSEPVTPSGPIFRSFGVGKLDWSKNSPSVNSQSFYHFNLTVAVPIGLSRPLFPEFEVIPGVTAAHMLKAQVDNNQLLKQVLMRQGLSERAAAAEQERVMKSIRPAVHFLADQANLWSVKPVVFFDYAHTYSQPQANPNGSWPAAGGGVQLTIVIAQLQAGYIHSIMDGSGPSPGNFIFRLTFQNLF